MKNRFLSLRLGLLTIAAVLLVSQSVFGGQAPGQRGGAAGGGQRGGPPAAPAGPVVRAADGKPDLSGYWEGSFRVGLQNIQTRNVLVDPPDTKIPYQAAYAARAAENAASRMFDEPELHCFISGVPHQMYIQFGFQIVQTPQLVGMFWEFMHDYRLIFTDGRPHIHDSIKLFQGDSTGRWEGDTLVVETTNQNDRTWLDTVGNIHSDAIHVAERFTPKDANTIMYEATVTDPKAYTRPWKLAETFRRTTTAGYEQYEYACLEGQRDLERYTEDQGGKAKRATPLNPAGK